MKRILFILLIILAPALVRGQIFFKVEGNGLASPSYLFGTHHLAPLSMLDSMPEVGEALASVPAIVGEIDMAASQANPMALVPFMSAPADSTLTKLFTPEEFDRLNTEFRKWAGGFDLMMFDSMKPIVPNMTVALAMVMEDIPDFVPGEQLDTYLQSVAVQSGKRVIPLETVEQQGEYLFNAVPIADQARALVDLLDKPDKAREEALNLNRCYFSHDIETLLKKSVEENEDPRLYETLLYKRNADWLSKLPGILADGPVFIAVGALHLAGDKGLVEELRRMGYEVTAIL